ncbi:pentapeptide repeat-containing protein [Actinomadura sp. NPDC023710]|uniref:pentapeptide repeat-containing protein n=1 Tax=Actinomadura sp. NPDC023710 TaxID=3158219 RepID=UPI003403808D
MLAVLGFPRLQHGDVLPFAQLLDVLKLVLGTVAGVGALFALVTAYRRQRLAEAAHVYAQRVDIIQQAHQERLARNAEHDAAELRITELYNAAAEQLGSDKAPVRLTALYTLERLANDNYTHRQTIVNIICAYLRMPYLPLAVLDPADARRQATRRYQAARTGSALPAGTAIGPDPREERQVRHIAQRILWIHLQSTAAARWADIDLDLTGATLMDFNLADCTLHTAWFSGAKFIGGAIFKGAEFSGDAFFGGAKFGGTAHFGGAKIGDLAYFDFAEFRGTAFFREAEFGGLVSFSDLKRNDESYLEMTQARVMDQSWSHVLPSGWRIDGSSGQLIPEERPAQPV